MSDYVKATNFTAKDSLPSGNSGKIIKGTEIDTEYTAIASAISSKADTNSPTFTGTPVAPTAAAGTNTTQLATTAFVITNGVPSGIISLWSGSIASIPSGWVICDGTNGTPDLRNKFVVGAGSTYAVGATGGSADAIAVSHTHTFSGTTGGMNANNPHVHYTYGAYGGGGNPGGSLNTSNPGGQNMATTATDIDHGHAFSGTTAAAGSSGTNANLPPYYALAYIMKS
jgi:hypothetical protein